MKSFILIIICFFSLSTNAQLFRRYQVKSGHIQYQVIRYATRSTIRTGPQGKMIAKSEQIPYVAKERDYYWDNYGDVAYETVWQISDFGKPLPQKKKSFERLWKGNHRYYYKKGVIHDDPYYLRIDCMKNKLLFNANGWFKVLYPKAKKIGTDTLLDKVCAVYRVDAYSEYALWKGLVLQETDYFTNRAGVRKGIERKTIAVKIESPLQEKNKWFSPEWLKKEKAFRALDLDTISMLMDVRPDLLQPIDSAGLKLKENDIIYYVTLIR